MHEVRDAVVLDLFAGSGGLGIECLSRGARHVDFVDNNKKVCLHLKAQLEQLGAQGYRVSHANAQEFLRRTERCYSLVFLDPPFASEFVEQTLNQLRATNVLLPGALIYCEFSKSSAEPEVSTELTLKRSGKAGESSFRLYQYLCESEDTL